MNRLIFPINNLSVNYLDCLLGKCMKSKALRQGKQVHALLCTNDLNIFSLKSKLVGVYAGCGDVNSARLVFDKIPNPNVFMLNWMVMASAFTGNFQEAIGYFSLMREFIYRCNKFTFSIVLKACVGLLDIKKGKQVHAVATQMGFENDVSVGNALIDMYSKCGLLCSARRVFHGMFERDVVSWTSMISGYCNVSKVDEAVVLFERMKLEGLEPNQFTYNAIIASYARRGDSNGAFAFFSRMTAEGFVPDLVTWNAMISGFAQSKRENEALKLFKGMLVSGIKPNNVTVTGVLQAGGLTGSIQIGREIHALVCRMGLHIDVFTGSALIDMYSKCGSLKDARTLFEITRIKNVASWNAMIGCYGKHGMVDSSIELFERMLEEGMRANEVTLISVLSACSHGGLVEKGLEIFRSMKERYGVKISKEHYACVVDMLCRSGRMVEAYDLLRQVPMYVTNSMAGAFRNGCNIHGRRDLAVTMGEEFFEMGLRKPDGFVMLSNICAADGEWHEAENLRKIMKEKNVQKQPGFSRVEKRNEFVEKEVQNESKAGIYFHKI